MPDATVAEAQIQTPEKPIAPKPIEKPKQPLGQTEAEMVKTIDSLGDGHTPDPDRSFRAILNFPILGKLREATNRFTGAKTESSNITEGEITQLESEAGIKSEADRLIEASLLVDKKFVDTAVITGNAKAVERTFGDKTWADWLDARVAARKHTGDISPDFILELHKKLSQRSEPALAGVLRDDRILGGDYSKLGTEAVYTQDQITALSEDPFIATFYQGENPNSRMILYPNTDIQQAHLFGKNYPLSEKAQAIYDQGGKTTESLVKGMLTDVADWYNAEQAKPDHDPHALAAELQKKIVSIHPVKDGSGRLSRLLMNWSLEKDGVPPAILGEPSNDILISSGKWTEEVKKGSTRHAEIQQRKQEMEKAGIKDMAELMGVDNERTFNEYVFKYIKRPPSAHEGGKLLSHKEFDDYLQSLRVDMQRFDQEFSTDSSIRAGKVSLHQGGLVPQSYIKLVENPSAAVDYVRDQFFTENSIYRGAICTEKIDDQAILRTFEKYVGVGSGYRALFQSGVESTSLGIVSSEKTAKSLEDFNRSMGLAYLAKNYPGMRNLPHIARFFKQEMNVGKSPLNIIANSLRGAHIGSLFESQLQSSGYEHNLPPFVSTSLSENKAYEYSQGADVAVNADIRHGILFEASVPKQGGILTFGTKTDVALMDIEPLQKYGSWTGIAEEELSIPGALDPRSINKIRIFDISNKKGEISPLAIEAERKIHDGENFIIITDYRVSKQGEQKRYRLNNTAGRFELVPDKQELPITA